MSLLFNMLSSLVILPIFKNPSHRNPPWLSNACATRKDPESEWLIRDNPETNSITWDFALRGRAVLLGYLTLLLSAQAPLSHIVSCFVSMCVPSDNSFPSVTKKPTLRTWNGSPLSATQWQDYSQDNAKKTGRENIKLDLLIWSKVVPFPCYSLISQGQRPPPSRLAWGLTSGWASKKYLLLHKCNKATSFSYSIRDKSSP